jgi:hypothetical protein
MDGARCGLGASHWSLAAQSVEAAALQRPPSGICIASRRGEFRHRRAEFRDGADAPRSAMMIFGERKL